MNVKPGDLAIMTNTLPIYSDLIGRIVHVVALVKEDWWLIEFDGPRPESIPQKGDLYARDKFLRPVSGLPDNEHTDEREPIKEMA